VNDKKDDKQLAFRLANSGYVFKHHHGPEFKYRIHEDSRIRSKNRTPKPGLEQSLCLITCSWGKGDSRIAAARFAIEKWKNQTIRPHIVFVEGLDETQDKSLFEDILPMDRCTHIVLKYDSYAQRGLMQKEAMLNIGARNAPLSKEVFVFVDCDCWSSEVEWMERIAEKFDETEEDILCQGFRHMQDDGPGGRLLYSFGTTVEVKLSEGEYRQPGLCWCMRRSLYDRMGGLNEKCISGSGDVMMLDELVDPRILPAGYKSFRFYSQAIRKIENKPRLTFADAYVVHQNHGPFKERAYWESRKVIEWTESTVDEMVCHDVNGMLKWIVPTNRLGDMLKDKALMSQIGMDKAAELSGFLKHNYNDVFGWFDFSDIYKQIVRECPVGGTIVEIGCFMGKSTCFLAVDAHNSGKNIKVVAADVFYVLPKDHACFTKYGCEISVDGSTYGICKKNVESTGAKVDLRKQDGIQMSEEFSNWSVFGCFIDASHTYGQTMKMLVSWWPKILENGFLCGHDYKSKDFPGVQQAVDEFCRDRNLELIIQGKSFVIRKRNK
jgi:hypothetical protein